MSVHVLHRSSALERVNDQVGVLTDENGVPLHEVNPA